MKRSLFVLSIAILMVALAIPVSAITRGGEADAGEHPYVGLMVAYSDELIDHDEDPLTPDVLDPLWRCSGALIDANVFVTAGHCTEEPAHRAAVWFAEDVDADFPGNGYPYLELGVDAGAAYAGDPEVHPLYNSAAFFLFDLGVVVLDGDGNDTLSDYASLPTVGAVDDLGKGRKKAEVEAVGYGLQKINPVMIQADRVRLKASLFVVNTTGVAGIGNFPTGEPLPSNSMMVSGDAKHGGTCFGDSGGPVLAGDSDVILGVTSFGLNGNCAGVGGAFRIDRQAELDWINGF